MLCGAEIGGELLAGGAQLANGRGGRNYGLRRPLISRAQWRSPADSAALALVLSQSSCAARCGRPAPGPRRSTSGHAAAYSGDTMRARRAPIRRALPFGARDKAERERRLGVACGGDAPISGAQISLPAARRARAHVPPPPDAKACPLVSAHSLFIASSLPSVPGRLSSGAPPTALSSQSSIKSCDHCQEQQQGLLVNLFAPRWRPVGRTARHGTRARPRWPVRPTKGPR